MQENVQIEPSLIEMPVNPPPDPSLRPCSKNVARRFLSKNISLLLPLSVFLLALVVRLLYNLIVARNYTPIFDAGLYDILARKLLNQHCYCIHFGYETVSRAPLWPFILAAIYALFGQHSLYGRLFYCLLGSCTCVITYLLARDLFGKRIGWFVGLLAAVYSGLFLYDGWLFAESLYTFFSMGFVYALFRLQRLPQKSLPSGSNLPLLSFWRQPLIGKRWLFCSALCIACANLARPNGSSLFALVVIWSLFLLVLKIWSWQTALKNTLIIVGFAALLILPWTYRNYLVSHRFVFVATGMGEVILGSYNDRAITHGSWWLLPPDAKIHDTIGYTPENDKQDTIRALVWVQTHITKMPSILLLHTINLWTPYHDSLGLPMEEFPTRISSKLLMIFIDVLSPIIFLLSAIGLCLTFRKYWRSLLIVYLVIIQTIILNVALYSTPRFRAPMEPLLVLLVGGVIWWMSSEESGVLRFFQKKRKTPDSSLSLPYPGQSPYRKCSYPLKFWWQSAECKLLVRNLLQPAQMFHD